MLELYISTVSGNNTIRSRQTYMQNILDSLKVKYDTIDIAAVEDAKNRMRKALENAGKKEFLPPQIFDGDEYLGVSSLFHIFVYR
ncbi:unnamed protein product [Schistocephalus solidus]|uniref:Glutaredoxin domain-containing protein n=1 Tax=Schistocephalus solidus TaxID=70667 RepID=A0A183TMA4_SCHSO|nr:unnamed protein product [Schistocephalus solidus]